MNKSSIEWTEFTSNPVKGKCPVDCSYCYVKPLRKRYGWHEDIRFYPEELERLKHRKKPSRIFMGSTIELFHDKTIQYMPEIIETVRDCHQHTFIFLTKQPQNLAKFDFPENCWVGVTATDFGQLYYSAQHLYDIKAKVKYISAEPLLGSLVGDTLELMMRYLNWVIIGACTGNITDLQRLASENKGTHLVRQSPKWTLQPKLEWVREIVEACDKAGIPVFQKNNLKPLLGNNLRQEMPTK